MLINLPVTLGDSQGWLDFSRDMKRAAQYRYMDSNGDMYNGSTIVNETDLHLTSDSIVQVNLGFQASRSQAEPRRCLMSVLTQERNSIGNKP